MILIEIFVGMIKGIARFFVWLITARDCDHCYWSYEGFGGYISCARIREEREECLNSVCRKRFERKCSKCEEQ